MRELSRIIAIPLTEEANGNMNNGFDRYMQKAKGGVAKLVSIGKEIKRLPPKVESRAKKIFAWLQEREAKGDGLNRLCSNYAILVELSLLVSLMIVSSSLSIPKLAPPVLTSK